MQLTGPHWAIVFGLQRMTKYYGKITIEHFFLTNTQKFQKLTFHLKSYLKENFPSWISFNI